MERPKLKHFFCDKIINGDRRISQNVLLTLDKQGRVVHMKEELDKTQIRETYTHLKGIVCPGFVNAHCHLELSHLMDKTVLKKGMTAFLLSVVKSRDRLKEEIEKAIEYYDHKMWENGIVAVGDICNTGDTIKQKLKSNIYYKNFIELSGVYEHKAEQVFKKGVEILKEFEGLDASLTPHAPYSCSSKLIKQIAAWSDKKNALFSIHSQESQEENELFKEQAGDFIDFYHTLGIDAPPLSNKVSSSLKAIVPYLPQQANILLVHNTFMKKEDWALTQHNKQLFFVFCPNSNLLIQQSLPNFPLFKSDINRLCVGTDSLASNTELSVFSELKTIQKHSAEFSVADLVAMATLNGAKSLNIDDVFGRIEVGKKPGINQIILDEKGYFESYKKIV